MGIETGGQRMESMPAPVSEGDAELRGREANK
jgi:hypothetical protein